MPLNRIVEALNRFIECAEEGETKGAAKAINAAFAAYQEIDKESTGRGEAKQKLKEIYEKLEQKDTEGAIEGAVEFRGNFEGALQMQNQIMSQFQEMKNAGIDPVQMAKDMTPFQIRISSLCFQNWKPNLPPEINLGYGMLAAFESGLRGDCCDSSPKKTLASVKGYENEFYLNPLELIDSSMPLSRATVLIKCLKENHVGMKSTIPLKVFIIDFIQGQIQNLLSFSGRRLSGADSICFEGMLAICFELGLRFFTEDPKAAKNLAGEPRQPTPY